MAAALPAVVNPTRRYADLPTRSNSAWLKEL